jgi:hypothetical protein
LPAFELELPLGGRRQPLTRHRQDFGARLSLFIERVPVIDRLKFT